MLVLWLADDAFRDAPLARLADLISWSRFTIFDRHTFLPVFNVLGPDNSGTLYRMILEAYHGVNTSEPPELHAIKDDALKCLSDTHIYSSQAAVAEKELFRGLPNSDARSSTKQLIEKYVKRGSRFSFERTNPSDEQIVDILWQEVERRGLKTKAKDNPPDHIAIISERDNYYARALCSTFKQRAPRRILSNRTYIFEASMERSPRMKQTKRKRKIRKRLQIRTPNPTRVQPSERKA